MVVMIGTALPTRGGVAAVVRVYECQGLLSREDVQYIATHSDGTRLEKLVVALRAMGRYWLALLLGRVTLLHVHSASGPSFWRKCCFMLPTLALGKPVVLHWHGGGFVAFFQRCNGVQQRLIRWVFRRCARVVALSPEWRDTLATYCPGSRVVVIPNPVEVPSMAAPLDLQPPTVLFLGMVHVNKGIYDLLRAWREVVAQVPDARLQIGGVGDVEAAQAEAQNLKLGESVQWLGWVSGETKQQALRQSAMLVLPSHAEAMPMAVLEAMATGVPVVASAVGGIPQAVRDGVDGLLVQPKDPQGLAAALLQLLQDGALRRRMGASARQRIQEVFAAERLVPQIEQLWQDVHNQEWARRPS